MKCETPKPTTNCGMAHEREVNHACFRERYSLKHGIMQSETPHAV